MIKTKKEIKIVIDPIKKDTISVFLYGDIVRAIWNRGYTSMSVEYVYFYELDDNVINVKEGVYHLTKEQINQLSAVIDHDAETKCESESLLHFSAFKILMSQNYSIPTADIEII